MSNLKIEDKLTSESFISQLNKINSLKENSIYSNEEYTNKKIQLIIDLINKGISQNLDDFLSDILSLKEKNILSLEEIKQIKSSLASKKNNKENTSFESKPEINKESVKSNSYQDDYSCCFCGDIVDLEKEEIEKKEFICPACGKLNKIEDHKNNINSNKKNTGNTLFKSVKSKYGKPIIILSILGIVGIFIYQFYSDKSPSKGTVEELVKIWWNDSPKEAFDLIIFDNNLIKDFKNMPDIYSGRKINIKKVDIIKKADPRKGVYEFTESFDMIIKVVAEVPVCKIIDSRSSNSKNPLMYENPKTEDKGYENIIMQHEYLFQQDKYGKWGIRMKDKPPNK